MSIFPITSLVRRVQRLILDTFDVSEQVAEDYAAELVALAEGWGSPETAAQIDWSYRIKKDLGERKKLRWHSEEERTRFEVAERQKYASWDVLIGKRSHVWPITTCLPWQTASVLAQTHLIARSLRHWTGRDLLPGDFSSAEFAEKVFHAPFILVSHGTEPDPILNYGNQAALTLWEMSWTELTRTPSRLTAEAPNREERARLLAAVTTRGFIDDYSGVRVSKTGRRFRIAQATVWNLLDERQTYCGQAAMFSKWEFIEC